MADPAVMNDCKDQVLHLLQDGLFESAEVLCSFVLSAYPPTTTGRGSSSSVRGGSAAFIELLADSLFAQGQFKRAALYFQQAGEGLGGGRGSGRPVESKDEARLAYKSALCAVELRDLSGAIRLLEAIPSPLRNVKVCVAMGKLYVDLGLKKSAIASYKQVLALLPSSVEAIENLVLLGLESGEIIEIVSKSSSKAKPLGDFLKLWVPKLAVALEHKFKCRNPEAFSSFSKLGFVFQRNVYLLTHAARAAACSREHGAETAALTFKSARSLDRYIVRGMDVYSSVLRRAGDARELALLSQELLTLHKAAAAETGPGAGGAPEPRSPCCEGWVAAAMHAELKGESDRALDFINKAVQMKPQNAVALKLKGNMLLARDRPEEAVVVFLQSNAIVKDVQCYEGITKVYLSLGRVSDAVLAAKECVLHMQQCPEAFVLIGSVLGGTAEGKGGAVKCYMRALKIDPNHDAALDAMSSLLSRMENADEAIKCLESVVKRKPSAQLLIKLAKILNAHAGVPHTAIEYLNDAIHLSAVGSAQHTEIAEELDVAERLLRGGDGFGDDGDDEHMNVSDELLG